MKLCLKCNKKLKSNNKLGYCRIHIKLSLVYLERQKKCNKVYYQNNIKELRREARNRYSKNKKSILKRDKIYQQKNKVKIKERKRKYYLRNKETILKNAKIYLKNNKKLINSNKRKYYKIRKLYDLKYRLKLNLRSRLNDSLRRFSWKKNTKFSHYIGCSLEELKQHLEKQFQEGMTWGNWSINGWHIDHIIPLSSAKSEEELYKLCHYSNLQPLWAKDNMKKGFKIMAAKRLRQKNVKAE